MAPVTLLIPLATHITSVNECMSHGHRNSSAISIVRNIPSLKAAILAFCDDIVRVKDRARATSMLTQVQLFFVDDSFFGILFGIPDVPATIAQIHVYQGLQTLQAQAQAAAAAKEVAVLRHGHLLHLRFDALRPSRVYQGSLL
ncbi:hypothetical protein H0H92_012480 [Tricholoma furcatifolium]|nr:hypothetical protein H0H92_012480 [Tricholoma furcatifolium]